MRVCAQSIHRTERLQTQMRRAADEDSLWPTLNNTPHDHRAPRTSTNVRYSDVVLAQHKRIAVIRVQRLAP